jgi:carboxyl-terminal processing protease
VNRKSASGAEILAAALQGNGRGVLVGEPTLGLGAIQTIYPLGAAAAGPALKLTSSYWYGPQDTELDGKPLEPDVPASAARAMAEARRWVSSAGAPH